MQCTTILQLFIVYLAIYELYSKLLNIQLAELPTISGSFFNGIADTTITCIGVERSHNVACKSSVKTEKSKWHPCIGALFSSTYHTKHLNSQTHQPVMCLQGYLQLAICLSRKDGAIQALMDVRQVSETSHSKSSPANFIIYSW